MFISNYEKHLIAKALGSATKNIVGLTSAVDGLFKVNKSLVTKVNELEDRIALLEGKNV